MAITNAPDSFNGLTPGEARQKALQVIIDLRDGKIDVAQAKATTSELKKHNAAMRRKIREQARELAKRNGDHINGD